MQAVTGKFTTLRQEKLSLIDWLFDELHGMFGDGLFQKFKSGVFAEINGQKIDTGVANMKRVWLEKLRENNFTLNEAKRGLAAIEKSGASFAPSWPQFLEFCRPPVNFDKAYYEALEGHRIRDNGLLHTWSHPAVFFASAPLRFELMSQTYSVMKDRWKLALTKELEKGEWPDIPLPSLSLPAPGKTTLDKEEAAKRLAELKAHDLYKPIAVKPQKDCKSWAKELMKRHEEGDKTLSMIQIQFAKEALKNDEMPM